MRRKALSGVGWRWPVLALAGAVGLWQAGQAVGLGVLGLPGVYAVAVPGPSARGDRMGGGVTTVAKTPPQVETPASEPEAPEVGPSVALLAPLAPLSPLAFAPPSTPAPAVRPAPTRLAPPPPEPRPAPPPAAAGRALPSVGDIRSWIRIQAREFVGGIDARGMPLYRFDLWLDAPNDVRQRIASVAYDFDAPSAKPKAQASAEAESGFRVRFGGASCARTVVVTVMLEDGSAQTAELDGCVLN